MGRWIGTVCGSAGRSVIFITHTWTNGDTAFAAWQQSHRLVIKDYLRNDRIDPLDSCLVIDTARREEADLLTLIEDAEEVVLKDFPFRTQSLDFISKLKEASGLFRLAGKKTTDVYPWPFMIWYIFVPADPVSAARGGANP